MADPSGPGRISWSTTPATVGSAAAGALVLGGLAALTADVPGRVLIGLAALGLAAAAGLALLRRPRLTAGPDGLQVRGVFRTRFLRWSEVAQVEVVTTRRLGRGVHTLEITPQREDTLLLLTRTDLGADPRDVLAALIDVRGRAG